MDAYLRYGPALVRKAQRLLGRRADAEDIVHALFVDLLQKGPATPTLAYLYAAVTRRCLNSLRDKKTRARLLAEKVEPAMCAPRTTLEGQAIDRDMVIKLLDGLDDASMEALIYRYVDDMTQDEVADLMGVSRKTVQKRLDRAHALARGRAS